jgi:hypothetical protein
MGCQCPKDSNPIRFSIALMVAAAFCGGDVFRDGRRAGARRRGVTPTLRAEIAPPAGWTSVTVNVWRTRARPGTRV